MEIPNEKTEDKTTLQCSACGLARPAAGWRCPNCQTAHGWHSLVDFSIPVLSLLVAMVALVPITAPAISDFIWPPESDIYIDADYIDGKGELLFTFYNIGEKSAIIPSKFFCGEPSGGEAIFFSKSPIIVQNKSSLKAMFEIELISYGKNSIIGFDTNYIEKHNFFLNSAIHLSCWFSKDNSKDDLSEHSFSISFNNVRSGPNFGTVDFQMNYSRERD